MQHRPVVPCPILSCDGCLVCIRDTGQEYEWVREYKFRLEGDRDDQALVTTCLLSLEEDRVVYNRLGSRMALQRRPRGAVTRPSRITVHKRELTQEEEEERAAVRQRLDPPGAEDDADWEWDANDDRNASVSP